MFAHKLTGSVCESETDKYQMTDGNYRHKTCIIHIFHPLYLAQSN